jgi:hypothetical protein
VQAVTTRQAVGDSPVRKQTVKIWNIMKSKLHAIALTILVWTGCSLEVYGQGTFQNLDFEAANVSGYQPGADRVPVETALPGWTAYYGGVRTSTVWYDNQALGSSMVSIQDTNLLYGFVPLDGNYSVSLDVQYNRSVAIGQTVQIPLNSLSVVFLFRSEGARNFEVSFAGHVLPYVTTWSDPNFDVCAVDIAKFVGQTGEFRFTESLTGRAIIDDIQFSSEAVPEPGTIALFALGAIAMMGQSARRKG